MKILLTLAMLAPVCSAADADSHWVINESCTQLKQEWTRGLGGHSMSILADSTGGFFPVVNLTSNWLVTPSKSVKVNEDVTLANYGSRWSGEDSGSFITLTPDDEIISGIILSTLIKGKKLHLTVRNVEVEFNGAGFLAQLRAFKECAK